MGLGQDGENAYQASSEVSYVANSQDTAGSQLTTNEVETKGHIVIPYIQGLCKSIQKICRRYSIQTHFNGNSIIKNLLVSHKNKDPMADKSGATYWFLLLCNVKRINIQIVIE